MAAGTLTKPGCAQPGFLRIDHGFAVVIFVHRRCFDIQIPLLVGAEPVVAKALLGKTADLPGQFLGLLATAAVSHQPVGQAHLQRFLGTHRSPGEDHIHCPAVANEAGQANSAAIDQGHSPAPTENPENGALLGYAEIAHQGQFQPTRDRMAGDGGDHRLAEAHAGGAQWAITFRTEVKPRCATGHGLQVCTGAEYAVLTVQHCNIGFGIRFEVAKRRGQPGGGRAVYGIANLRPVNDDGGDAVPHFDTYAHGAFGSEFGVVVGRSRTSVKHIQRFPTVTAYRYAFGFSSHQLPVFRDRNVHVRLCSKIVVCCKMASQCHSAATKKTIRAKKTMKLLSPADKLFLLAERRESPMHVGGLNLFTLPDGVDEQEFLHNLADNMRLANSFQHPFSMRLKIGRTGILGPVSWKEDASLDLDYHIRHGALPKPGRYRELFSLVSRLHGTLMDRNRPLWELNLIEGLQNRQFAVYSKFHHAAVDGIRAVSLIQSMFSSDPDERINDSPLSLEAGERYRKALQSQQQLIEPPDVSEIENVANALKKQFDSSAQLARALGRVARTWALQGRGDALQVPWFKVPPSPINTRIDGARRFVAQSFDFARIKAVGKALDGTLNDAVLAMCAGALRRQLESQNGLPDESLKAMVPISLRKPGDLDSGNAVGAISADLATNIADPVDRFVAIQASMRAGKSLYDNLSAREAMLLNVLVQTPALLVYPLGLITRFPPISTTISNVPGPRHKMYWNGATLNGIYPASIVVDGVALNITLVSYHDQLDFGITACRRSLPQAQRFIDYLEESLAELERALGITSSAGRERAKKRAVATQPSGARGKKTKANPGKKRSKSRQTKTDSSGQASTGSVAD